tara:strand:+ start:1058 stop:1213 length:156 start_codon:yes stop_codon:yes gene_type:complete
MTKWEKPIIEILGSAKDLIQGGTPGVDPKTQTQPDDNVFVGFDAGTEVNEG